MKKFEVGKRYTDDDNNIEIIILKRTDKTVVFKYTSENWWSKDTEKEFRKKTHTSSGNETIHLGDHWSAPQIGALSS